MRTAPSPKRTTSPTIRELVETLAARPGVQASILVGEDGLVIESRTAAGVDGEHLAAHVPTLVAAAEELGSQAARGGLVTSVIEYERGTVLISTLTADALLLVLLHASANVGPLLFEVRRFRSSMAAIV
jgi:predicted regulator of Ras-like GTPase activity (Roadblock/LC7/MglB family)